MEERILVSKNYDTIYGAWKSKCGRYTVSLTKLCLTKMIKAARDYYPKEIGTSLVGSYSDDGFDAIVLDTTPITSDSIMNTSLFHRGIKELKDFFAKLLKNHSGKRYYVGEWHSHPNNKPTPSETDNIAQLAIASDRKTNCPECILVIVGEDIFNQPDLGVYVYSRKKGKINLFANEM